MEKGREVTISCLEGSIEWGTDGVNWNGDNTCKYIHISDFVTVATCCVEG